MACRPCRGGLRRLCRQGASLQAWLPGWGRQDRGRRSLQRRLQKSRVRGHDGTRHILEVRLLEHHRHGRSALRDLDLEGRHAQLLPVSSRATAAPTGSERNWMVTLVGTAGAAGGTGGAARRRCRFGHGWLHSRGRPFRSRANYQERRHTTGQQRSYQDASQQGPA